MIFLFFKIIKIIWAQFDLLFELIGVAFIIIFLLFYHFLIILLYYIIFIIFIISFLQYFYYFINFLKTFSLYLLFLCFLNNFYFIFIFIWAQFDLRFELIGVFKETRRAGKNPSDEQSGRSYRQ